VRAFKGHAAFQRVPESWEFWSTAAASPVIRASRAGECNPVEGAARVIENSAVQSW